MGMIAAMANSAHRASPPPVTNSTQAPTAPSSTDPTAVSLLPMAR
jgi:hypothetical protein